MVHDPLDAGGFELPDDWEDQLARAYEAFGSEEEFARRITPKMRAAWARMRRRGRGSGGGQFMPNIVAKLPQPFPPIEEPEPPLRIAVQRDEEEEQEEEEEEELLLPVLLLADNSPGNEPLVPLDELIPILRTAGHLPVEEEPLVPLDDLLPVFRTLGLLKPPPPPMGQPAEPLEPDWQVQLLRAYATFDIDSLDGATEFRRKAPDLTTAERQKIAAEHFIKDPKTGRWMETPDVRARVGLRKGQPLPTEPVPRLAAYEAWQKEYQAWYSEYNKLNLPERNGTLPHDLEAVGNWNKMHDDWMKNYEQWYDANAHHWAPKEPDKAPEPAVDPEREPAPKLPPTKEVSDPPEPAPEPGKKPPYPGTEASKPQQPQKKPPYPGSEPPKREPLETTKPDPRQEETRAPREATKPNPENTQPAPREKTKPEPDELDLPREKTRPDLVELQRQVEERDKKKREQTKPDPRQEETKAPLETTKPDRENTQPAPQEKTKPEVDELEQPQEKTRPDLVELNRQVKERDKKKREETKQDPRQEETKEPLETTKANPENTQPAAPPQEDTQPAEPPSEDTQPAEPPSEDTQPAAPPQENTQPSAPEDIPVDELEEPATKPKGKKAAQAGGFSESQRSALNSAKSKTEPPPGWEAKKVNVGATEPHIWENKETGERMIVKDAGKNVWENIDGEELASEIFRESVLPNTPEVMLNEEKTTVGASFLGDREDIKSYSNYKQMPFDEQMAILDDLENPDDVISLVISDLAIGNRDRNPGNLMFARKEDGSLEMVPIDHGWTFQEMPENFSGLLHDWMDERQVGDKIRDVALELMLEKVSDMANGGASEAQIMAYVEGVYDKTIRQLKAVQPTKGKPEDRAMFARNLSILSSPEGKKIFMDRIKLATEEYSKHPFERMEKTRDRADKLNKARGLK